MSRLNSLPNSQPNSQPNPLSFSLPGSLLFPLLFSLLLCCPAARAQDASSPKAPKKAGDLIESTSYNDHKRGKPRTLQYLPDGEDFVCINGRNRYTRALYGSPTAWRLETSDRPIFATYVKRNSRNIRFRLHLPGGAVTPLEETTRCEARYTPGRRSYTLTDAAWGKDACLKIAVLASPTEEEAIWEFRAQGLPEGCTLEALNAPIRLRKLSRSGDMGADPPGCFDPAGDDANAQTTFSSAESNTKRQMTFSSAESNTAQQTTFSSAEGNANVHVLSCPLPSNYTLLYISISGNELRQIDSPAPFAAMEDARRALAGRIRITTPDPYLNTLGGALAVAADGIWGEEGVWLHGAVGWRMPLSGWRAAYTGDALGWHDRARRHFDNYAASQVTDVPCTRPHPAQDSALALARSVKQWGTPQYSNGYICRNPRRNDQMHHYDMNLCYIDELLWHFNWTGDLDYARRLWPVLTLHLAWEKRNFDPDNDGLYDAYACIWASDALYYNSGAVTHSTAYNYRANRMAALLAEKIGEDPAPYRQEADKILSALNARLWLPEKGHWAEFQDFMGHRRLHESAAVWTIYHALDSDVADPFQAYLATRYVDAEIPHIPITVSEDTLPAAASPEDALPAAALSENTLSAAVLSENTLSAAALSEDALSAAARIAAAVSEINSGGYATVSTTNWLPYSWSINNVAFAEVMHTALAYFQAGRAEVGCKLLKSSVLDGMYLGESPGNFGQISFYDAARGECYRDFGDPIGVASRVLIQGLYGILPDALNNRLLLRPGFPLSWRYASLHTPDIDFDFKTDANASSYSGKSLYTFTHRLLAVHTVELQFPARLSQVARLLVNGQAASWKLVEPSVAHPVLSVSVSASSGEPTEICIEWEGEPLPATAGTDILPATCTAALPATCTDALPTTCTDILPTTCTDTLPASRIKKIGPSLFVAMEQGQMKWWAPVEQPKQSEQPEHPQQPKHPEHPEPLAPSHTSSFEHIVPSQCSPVTMDAAFNANVTDIFRNEYLSPRSPYTTLQIPKQGIGEWCHPLKTATIDDSGLRAAVGRSSHVSTRNASRAATRSSSHSSRGNSHSSDACGLLQTKLDIPFRTPAEGRNIAFTSLWDNYPDSLKIPLTGSASRAYLLMAGSTNHMQCHIANGIIRVYYQDGTCDTMPLVNPDNWPPIEQIFFEDGKAFNRHAPALYRLRLKTGELSNNFGEELGFPGVSREIDGGAAVLLEMPLNAHKSLSHLVLETLSNEVVIGIMGITLQR